MSYIQKNEIRIGTLKILSAKILLTIGDSTLVYPRLDDLTSFRGGYCFCLFLRLSVAIMLIIKSSFGSVQALERLVISIFALLSFRIRHIRYPSQFPHNSSSCCTIFCETGTKKKDEYWNNKLFKLWFASQFKKKKI